MFAPDTAFPGAGVALAVLLAAVPCGASEVCLETDYAYGCCPCDLAIEMDWVGHSTDGPACGTLPSIPSSLAEYRNQYPERYCAWWIGLWTLSASTSDPFDVISQPSLEMTLYLWLVDSGCGYGFGSGPIEVSSEIPIVSYEPLAAGNHWWTPAPDQLGGSLFINSPTCRTPCGPGQFWDEPRVIGRFRLTRTHREAAPLEDDNLAAVRWSRVKTLYR